MSGFYLLSKDDYSICRNSAAVNICGFCSPDSADFSLQESVIFLEINGSMVYHNIMSI